MTLADWTERLPRTSVRNYHYSLRNNPKKRSYLLLRSGSLKSRFFVHVSCLKLQRFIVYRNVSMSVVLYRPSTLPPTLWEEYKLRVHQVSSYMFRYSMGVIIRETSQFVYIPVQLRLALWVDFYTVHGTCNIKITRGCSTVPFWGRPLGVFWWFFDRAS